jgi:hypothetical protein
MQTSAGVPGEPEGQYQNWVAQPVPQTFASGAQPHVPFVHAYAE